MIIDIHVHEKTYSSCSCMSLDEIVERAQEIGLNGLCITDHDSMGLKEKIYNFRKWAKDLVLLSGVEILTHEGDILVFGLHEVPKHKMHAAELLDLVEKKGGVGIAAHIYRQNNRGLGDKAKELKKLSGIEGLNGNTSYKDNQKAIDIANYRKEAFLGGSDAHKVADLGKYATRFFEHIQTEKDLVRAIKKRNYSPVCYNGFGFHSYAKENLKQII